MSPGINELRGPGGAGVGAPGGRERTRRALNATSALLPRLYFLRLMQGPRTLSARVAVIQ